jgi:predicted alpha/beta superfamily hydrolase
MKKLCLAMTIVVFALIFNNGLQAQTVQTKLGQICLDNTEQFSITSKYVQGENYLIQVGLPISYKTSQKSYPVLYVLDGDVTFVETKAVADWLQIVKEIKDIIVIGISYGQGIDYWFNRRDKDLIPRSNTARDTSYAKVQDVGEADNFLKFIQYELFPLVNKNYRTNPDSSTITGVSLGGLFNSYILFTQPELFKAYIINEPVLVWKNNSILKLEAEYFSNHKELNTTVYMACGSMDSLISIDEVIRFIQMIQMHNYKGLKFVPRMFEGETHLSLPSAATANGLKTLFKR